MEEACGRKPVAVLELTGGEISKGQHLHKLQEFVNQLS